MRSGVTDWVHRFAIWTDYFAFRDEAVPARRYDRYLPWLYAAVVVVSMWVLFARMPEMILDPRFYAEDGRIFYQETYNLGPLASVITPYAGYYHLLPRIIASVSLALPLVHVPLFFGLIALIITSVALSWFFLPHFRPFVANDWIRLGVVALCLTSPNLEALMVIAYMQWYVAAWCVFVILMKPPHRLWLQWAIALAYVVGTATAPIVVLLAPIWLIRLYHARSTQRYWIGCMLLAQIVIVWLTLRASLGMPVLFEFDRLVLDLWRAFASRVVSLTLLGNKATNWLLQWFGWRALYLLTGIVLVTIVLIVIRRRSERKYLFLSSILVFLVLVTTSLYAYRASHHGYTFAWLTDFIPWGHARYFFLGSVGLYLFFALHADYLMRHKPTNTVRSTLLSLYFAVLIGYVVTFRMPFLGVGNWHRYGIWLTTLLEEPQEMLSHVIVTTNVDGQNSSEQENKGFQIFLPIVTASNREPDGRQPVAVPILPQPWCMTLRYIPSSPVKVYFPHGFSLVGANADIRQDHVILDFLWTSHKQIQRTDQTIWFEFVDDEGLEVLRQPDALVAPEEVNCFPRLFASRHLLPLPQDFAGGTYDLLISLTDSDAPVTSAAVTARFPGLVRPDR